MDRRPYAIPLAEPLASREDRGFAYREIESPDYFFYPDGRADLDWSIELSSDPMKIPGHSGPRPTY